MSWNRHPDPDSSQPDDFSSLLGTRARTSSTDGKTNHIVAAAVDLLLTSVFGAFQPFGNLSNPVGGIETASYDTTSEFLIPGSEVARMAPGLSAGAPALPYHHPSYPTTGPGHTFDERFGIT